MIEFVPFRPEHLALLRLQAAQAYLQTLMDKPEYGEAIVGDFAYSGVVAGHIVGSAGILPQWPGRAICWALLTAQADRRVFVAIHRKVRAVIAAAQRAGHRRIETTVDAGFDAGHRWALALGFTSEGLMRAYSPDGRDHVLYAKVA